MDICSSLASALGGLSQAGGPPGAVLGALFSTISMILDLFAPKPPSLISQIETLMRDLEAEKKDSQISAAGEAVRTYAEACDEFMKPAKNGGVQDPDLLSEEAKEFSLIDGNAIRMIREVRNWLLKEGNQELDAWPVVLNLLCDAYMHVILTVTRQNLYAHDAQRMTKYVGEPADPAKSKKWAKLQTKMQVKFQNLTVNNRQMAEFLEKAVPVARKRGVFVIAYSGAYVYVASGPKAFTEAGRWGSGVFNHCRRMAITAPREGVNSPAAQYDIWVLDSSPGRYAFHARLDTRTRVLTAPYADHVGEAPTVADLFSDWWPVVGDGSAFTVYGARNYAEGGALEAWTWNREGNRFERINWRPVTAQKLVQVRVARSLTVRSDDPEKDEMPEGLLKGGSIIYGTLEGSRDIFVLQGSMQTTVPIPMASYSGIAVDSCFLWMYGRDGFACATHASVMSCINKKRPMPRWLGPPAKNVSPVLDLSSCQDGTLTVSAPERLVTGVYHIDFNAPGGEGRWLSIEQWEQFVDGTGAQQVQKLPVFGWPLIDRTMAAVSQPA